MNIPEFQPHKKSTYVGSTISFDPKDFETAAVNFVRSAVELGLIKISIIDNVAHMRLWQRGK